MVAATDTLTTVMCHLLQLLAEHPDIQEQLRTELTLARDGDDIPNERLMKLPVLDAVCKETLRL
jgi:cytochrome P450